MRSATLTRAWDVGELNVFLATFQISSGPAVSAVSAVSALSARKSINISVSSPALIREDVVSAEPSRLKDSGIIRSADSPAERPRKRRKRGGSSRKNVGNVAGDGQTQAVLTGDDNEGGTLVLETLTETRGPEIENGEVLSKVSEGDFGQNSEEASLESFENESSDDPLSLEPASVNRQLSTFRPSPSNVLHEASTEWTVRLGRKDTLAILGQYDIWVRKGAISISGAILRASSKLHRVYTPTTHAIPVIRPSLDPYGSGPQTSEITFFSCRSGLRSLKRISTRFGRIWNGRFLAAAAAAADTSRPLHRSFINLGDTADDAHNRPLRPLEQPKDWFLHLSGIVGQKAAKVLICGPKGSGKSTFCRLLSNNILSVSQQVQSIGQPCEHALYMIDLDPGQPEFSPPGDISLIQISSFNLSVPYAHPRQSPDGDTRCIRSHHIGSVSPRDDPKHYLDCALDLLNVYDHLTKNGKASPLVINCFGWIQGTGLDLLKRLIQASSSSQVLYLSTTGPDEVSGALASASEKAKAAFHKVESQPLMDGARIASELRAMQAQSYFHLVEPEVSNLRWDCRPLTDMEPLIVPYSGPKQAVAGVMVVGEERNPEMLPAILDGSIVGILLVEADGLFEPTDGGDHDTSENAEAGELHDRRRIRRASMGIPYIAPHNHTTVGLNPKYSRCVGQALVRSIDIKNKCFHLSTPVPSTELQLLYSEGREIVLVRGQLDTPTWAYKETLEWEKERGRQGLKKERDDIIDVAEGDLSREEEDMQWWSARQPWVSVVDGETGPTGKARRIRRDIKYRNQ